MIVESFMRLVDAGREGRNQGISMGLPKLESIIDGVTRSTNTLIFSNSGSGKTSLALFAYIYKPLIEHLDDDLFKVIFFSLEMTGEMLMAKLLATHIFYKYGIELSVKELLSRKKDYRLSDDLYQIVLNEQDWLQKIEKHVFIYDKQVSADSIYAITMKQLEKYGKFSETESRQVYTPYNPDRLILAVVDHVG